MMLKPILAICCCALLASCGGGAIDSQQVTGMQARPLAYGKQAVIFLTGDELRSTISVNTGICKDPTFNSSSGPTLAIVNCTVSATGDQPITVTGSGGQLLYQGTLSVPQPQVALHTSMGDIVLELSPRNAPITVNNFLMYVNGGFYTNLIFHRVVPGFVVQGGGFNAALQPVAGAAPIKLEAPTGLSNLRGAVAMARTSDPNSAVSQFFIDLADNTFLDTSGGGYAVFGHVVSGMSAVDAIAAVPTQAAGGLNDVPVTPVVINSAVQTQ